MDEYSQHDLDKLATLAAQGDRNALDRICEATWSRLVSWADTWVRDTGISHVSADDIAQQTLLKAFCKLDQFEPGTAFLSWLYQICYREYLQAVRAHKGPQRGAGKVARLGHRDTLVVGDGRTPHGDLERKEDLELFRQAIEDLPPTEREAVVLYHIQGLSYSQIAQFQQCANDTVKLRLRRGREKLKCTYRELAGES